MILFKMDEKINTKWIEPPAQFEDRHTNINVSIINTRKLRCKLSLCREIGYYYYISNTIHT